LDRSPEVIESIVRLTELPHWQRLKDEANKHLERFERSLSRALFRSRSEPDLAEIEYARGFRQGVTYVLEGLPNTILEEWKTLNAEEKEVD
jgi:hypothetical protein